MRNNTHRVNDGKKPCLETVGPFKTAISRFEYVTDMNRKSYSENGNGSEY